MINKMKEYFNALFYQNICTQKLLQCVLVALGIEKEKLKEILIVIDKEAREQLEILNKELEKNGD